MRRKIKFFLLIISAGVFLLPGVSQASARCSPGASKPSKPSAVVNIPDNQRYEAEATGQAPTIIQAHHIALRTAADRSAKAHLAKSGGCAKCGATRGGGPYAGMPCPHQEATSTHAYGTSGSGMNFGTPVVAESGFEGKPSEHYEEDLLIELEQDGRVRKITLNDGTTVYQVVVRAVSNRYDAYCWGC